MLRENIEISKKTNQLGFLSLFAIEWIGFGLILTGKNQNC